jgi:Uma2 family endonuclease
MAPTLKLSDMTVAEFLEWCPEDGHRWQLVDGEPLAMAPAKPQHGAIQNEAGRLIANHLESSARPCVVMTTPGVIPRLRPGSNFRVPDLGVTCAPVDASATHLDQPVLLIGVLSRSNRAQTRANVWAYTTLPSVQEIVVLHAEKRRAELLRRGTDGAWPEEPDIVTEGDLVLESIGFRAPLAALYRTTALAG